MEDGADGRWALQALQALQTLRIPCSICPLYRPHLRSPIVTEYTRRWTALHCVQLEGIAQRIQEDTNRFGHGVETCASDVLDALLTLIVFTPTLVDLGREVEPVAWVAWLAPFGAGWMIAGALGLSTLGWIVSLLVAQRLVALEVSNQVVEAEFRKRLVLTEVGGVVHADGLSPSVPGGEGDEEDEGGEGGEGGEGLRSRSSGGGHQIESPPTSPSYFDEAFAQLRVNYRALFHHFFGFDAWISIFDQAMIILPYAVVAPMLFRHTGSISLGTLVKTSSVFGRVFNALSLPAYNWASVNDFRSVVQRLVRMEQTLGIGRGVGGGGRVDDVDDVKGVEGFEGVEGVVGLESGARGGRRHTTTSIHLALRSAASLTWRRLAHRSSCFGFGCVEATSHLTTGSVSSTGSSTTSLAPVALPETAVELSGGYNSTRRWWA